MVVDAGSPKFGGIGWHLKPPRFGKDYKWYINVYKWYDIPANWGMDYATYHLLGEPETTIDPGNISYSKRIEFGAT